MSGDGSDGKAGKSVRVRSAEIDVPVPAATLTEDEYELFARVGRARRVEAGERLFHRGDLGTSMFVVAQGAVDLDFGDDLIAKRLGPREFFGELGLLIGDHARSADATAASPGLLLELRQEEFDALADRNPRLLAHFLRRAIMRVVLNEQNLIGRLRRRNLELQTAFDTLRTTTHQLNQTEELTRTDELTGLCNRRGFQVHLKRRRQDDPPASARGLLLIDCDRFKSINDDHGHLVGDRVLQGVANILRSAAGPEDVACRLGGDEFCLVIKASQQAELLRMADFVLSTARALHRLQLSPPQIATLSIGACLMSPEEEWDDCYALADAALYRAKRLGGNRVEWQDGAASAA